MKRRRCPDCNSYVMGGRLEHKPSCPLLAALSVEQQDDLRWFLDNPDMPVRVREFTATERIEFAALVPGLDLDRYLCAVTRIGEDLRARAGIRRERVQ